MNEERFVTAYPNKLLIVSFLISSFVAAGCAGTREAIESRELETSVKMSDTIFLEPVEPENKIIWIHVRNTSDRQDMDPQRLQDIIAGKLEARGYKITDSPKRAYYRLQANILFADHERKGLTQDGMLLGGFSGGILGSQIGGDQSAKLAAGVVGAVAGAVIGGIVGSKYHVDKYMLVVDLQISEKTGGNVETTSTADSNQGSVKKTQTTTGGSNYLKYQTRMIGSAKKTNLKWSEASPVLFGKFASSLAGIF